LTINELVNMHEERGIEKGVTLVKATSRHSMYMMHRANKVLNIATKSKALDA
jgi:hypothetical protein